MQQQGNCLKQRIVIRWIMLLMAAVTIILVQTNTFAQNGDLIETTIETTPQVDPPTNTPIPSSVPEVTETPAPITPLPEETATATFSDLPTANPDVTETPTPPTLAPVPTETPLLVEPSLTLLIRDTFDSNDFSGWTGTSGWSYVPNDMGFALQATPTSEQLQLQRGPFYNVVVQVRLQMDMGQTGISLRQSSVGEYRVLLDTNGTISLYRAGVAVATILASPLAAGSWHNLRLSVVENVVRVAVDDNEVLVWTDEALLPPGKVSINGLTGVTPNDVNATFRIEDFFLWVPSNEIDLYSATPTIEVSPSAMPTAEATVAVLSAVVAAPCNPDARIIRASVNSEGEQADAPSQVLSLSADGRYVVFASTASNLGGSPQYRQHIYVYDHQLCETSRISVAPDGTFGNSRSHEASISTDGQFVAFSSEASNLVAGIDSGSNDIFLRDRQTNSTIRVSIGINGVQPNGSSWHPVISGDGRYVAFVSDATNLVNGDMNGVRDIFLFDRQTSTLRRISTGFGGANANNLSDLPSISSDGRFVVFVSQATNLVKDVTTAGRRVYLFDRETNTITLVSRHDFGPPANWADTPVISGDGHFVTFVSKDIYYPSNSSVEAFLQDLQTGYFVPVSRSKDKMRGGSGSTHPSISANGRYVVFESRSDFLVLGDTYNTQDVFVYDSWSNSVLRISQTGTGDQADAFSEMPLISADGKYIAFGSLAANLVQGDTNGAKDVYLAQPLLWPSDPSNLTVTATDATQFTINWTNNAPDATAFYLERFSPGTNQWTQIAILEDGQTTYIDNDLSCGAMNYQYRVRAFRSSDGLFSAYSAIASETTARCVCNNNDVITRVSVDSSGGQSNGMSFIAGISADGRYVIFNSNASNLVANDTNGAWDGFVYDRDTCLVKRLWTPDGSVPDFGSWVTSLSADGEYITFATAMSQSAQWGPLYVYNQETGATALVSIGIDGQPVQSAAITHGVISANGRYVVFLSNATNLVDDVNSGEFQVYVRDMQLGITLLVSATSEGIPADKNLCIARPAISADGRYIVFESGATNFTPNGFDRFSHLYRRDMQTGALEVVSISSSGTPGNETSTDPAISADGRYVAFSSYATNLVSNDTNNAEDIFVHDMQTGITKRISVSTTGLQSNNPGVLPTQNQPSISADGRYITFVSEASNLDVNDTNGVVDIFVHDMQTGITNRVWSSFSGEQGNGRVLRAFLTDDGSDIAFSTDSNNLIPHDTNGFMDVFVYNNLAPGAPQRLSAVAVSQSQINLQWKDNSFAETGFTVERSLNGSSNWVSIAATDPNQTTYQDMGLNCNTASYYRVKAQGGELNSTYSNVANSKTLACQIPGIPRLSLPANNTFSKDDTPLFSWIPSGGGVGFQIQIDNQADFVTPEQDIQSGKVSLSLTTPLPEGLYYWRVRALNMLGVAGAWSTPWKFTIDYTAQPSPVLTSPINRAVVSAVRPTFVWAAIGGAYIYNLQVDDDPTFSNPNISANSSTNRITVSNTTLPLQQGTYYWKVRTVDAAGNIGDWGAAGTFIVNLALTPADMGIVVATAAARPTLTWASAGQLGAKYVVEIARDPNFKDVKYTSQALTTTSHLLPSTAALEHGLYYWRIQVNDKVPSTEVYRQFTVTPVVPSALGAVEPAHRFLTNSHTVAFSWNPPGATVAGGPFTYQLQISQSTSFANLIVNKMALDGTNTDVNDLSDGVFYWRVRAVNRFNIPGAWSVTRLFTVDTIAPNAPSQLKPTTATIIFSVRPTLTWTASPGANRYRIDLANNANFSSLLVEDYEVSTLNLALTVAVLPSPLAQGTYYWRVAARDAALNWGTDSVVSTFIVNLAQTPADGKILTVLSSIRPTFVWSSANLQDATYRVEIATDPDFAQVKYLSLPLTTTSHILPTDQALLHGIYYWRVWVNDVVPPALVYRLLTVTPAAAAPLKIKSPINQELSNAKKMTFMWDGPAATVGGEPFTYQIQVSKNSTFGSLVINEPLVETTQFEAPDLADGLYYWRVRATNRFAVSGSWSGIIYFTVDTTAPVPPTLRSPAHQAVVTTTHRPTLAWNAVSGVTTYTVEVARDAAFTDCVIEGAVVSATYYTLPDAFTNGTYYWRVYARDRASNTSSASEIRAFAIALP